MMKRTRLGLALVASLLVTALAACGAGKASPGASPSLDPQAMAIKWAQCMRDQGINMPDPARGGDPGSGSTVIDPATKGDPDKMKAATEKCRQYEPNGGAAGKLDAAALEKMRQAAKCMRDNGVSDYPDPNTDGTMNLGGSGVVVSDGSGTGPGSAIYQKAQEKCFGLLPAATGLPVDPSPSAKP